MRTYTKFRVEARLGDKLFKVYVRGWFVWKSAFMATNYFEIRYETKALALDAIEGYKNRLTDME